MNNPLEKEVTLITGEKIKVGEFLNAYRKIMHLKNNKPHLYEEILAGHAKTQNEDLRLGA